MEMHLESRTRQKVRIPSLDLRISFAAGETIHTENSYKYRPGQPEELLTKVGFTPTATWTDKHEQFAVCLARAGN